MRIRLAALIFTAGLAVWAYGQGRAPRATTSATIGAGKVTVDYGQPALKGRNFADLMKQLPQDRMWRAGSGAVTTFSTDADLLIGGKRVPAGKYSLYIHCPETGGYSLVLNSDLGQPLSKIWSEAPPSQANEPYPHFEYTKEVGSKEVARAALAKTTVPETDLLTYTFKPSGSGALLTISWGNQAWSLEMRPAK
jgi:Protein of unknown function (DUF2911)